MLSDPEFFERDLLTVSREQAELAASEVSGCEACSAAQIHFDWILADVVSFHGMFEFVMDASVKCPLCHAPVSEKTLSIVAGLKQRFSSSRERRSNLLGKKPRVTPQ